MSNLLVKESFSIFFLGILSATWAFSIQIVGLNFSFFMFLFILGITTNLIFTYVFKWNLLNIIALLLCVVNFFYFILGIYVFYEKNIFSIYLIEYFIKEILLILFAIVYSSFFYKKKNIDFFFLTLFCSLIPLMFFYFIYYKFYLGADFIGSKIDLITNETREGKNTLSYSLMVMLPFFFVYFYKILRNQKILFFSLIIFYLLFCLNVDSRATNLCFFIILLFFLFIICLKKSPNTTFFLILSLLLIFSYKIDFFLDGYDFIYNYLNQKKSVRLELLSSALQGSVYDNFFGLGTATFRIHKDVISYEAHNVFLTYLYEKGIIGLTLNIFFYFSILFFLFKKKFEIISYEMAAQLSLISNLFLFLFINVETSPLLWIFNAIYIGISYKNKSRK